jgi:glycosyltransferase involved in cell wall biosynthesis
VIGRLNMGGPAHQAALLSGRRLDGGRYETLLVHGSLAAGEESMADMAEEEGARLHFLPRLVQPVRPTEDARALAALVRLARAFRPQIVHTHTAKAGFLGRQAALAVRPRPAVVHTYHGHVLEGYFGRLRSSGYLRLERGMARVSDCLVGVSQATVDDLVRLGVAPREKFRVIPLGLDLERLERLDAALGPRLRAELGLADRDVLLLFAGRLAPVKRVDMLLSALALARRSEPRLRLAVAGDGELRPALQEQARRLGLGSAVRFLGYRRDLRPALAAADVAVLSSRSEGTPVFLIEAGAAGLPSVATAVGGVPETIGPGTGFLVAPGDAEAFAAALVGLARGPELRGRLGAAARERALGRYRAERLLRDVAALYEELVA